MRCVALVLLAASSAAASMLDVPLVADGQQYTVTYDLDGNLFTQARDATVNLKMHEDGTVFDRNVRAVVSAIRVAAGEAGDAFLGTQEALRVPVTVDGGAPVDLVVFEGEQVDDAAVGFAERHGLNSAAAQQIAAKIAELAAPPTQVYATNVNVQGTELGQVRLFSNQVGQELAVARAFLTGAGVTVRGAKRSIRTRRPRPASLCAECHCTGVHGGRAGRAHAGCIGCRGRRRGH